MLGKDITLYGDGNPGAANVFRAGSVSLGLTAVMLDIAKGIPVVWLAHAVFNLPYAVVIMIGISAILGHAFSPILNFKGGKAIAVTFGVLIAFPQHDLLLMFIIFTVLGFLFIEQHSWVAMMGPIGTFLYLLVDRGLSAELVFILCLLALFMIKQNKELRTMPVFEINIIKWMRSKEQETDIKKQNL
jgi:glycerol-3-phosphate acyltransferase PlsY